MAQAEKTEKDLGPLMKVKFVNIESPGVDIRFNYQGEDYGPLSDGEVYELPREVVKHLNGLSIAKMEYRIDPATGQARSAMKGRSSRFSCHPLD